MEPFIGQIQVFGFSWPPQGWALCDGTLQTVSSNSALFSLIGTVYGGDGRTTFGLPDLRGRSIVGAGQGPGLSTINWGQKGGAEDTSISLSNLPPHSHAFNLGDGSGTTAEGQNAYLATTTDGDTVYTSTGPTGQTLGSATVSSTGGNGSSFHNMAPFLVLNHCIATAGLYPVKN